MASVYYGRLLSTLLSDHYWAAYNAIFAAYTRDLLPPDVVSAAVARSLSYLPEIYKATKTISTPLSMCLLAQAFAEADIPAAVVLLDGSTEPMPWYRVKNVVEACAQITDEDIASIKRATLKFPGAIV